MKLADAYTIVVTDKLVECKEFYERWFSFETTFESSWFIFLTNTSGAAVTIAFMHPDHPSSPPTPGRYNGDGAFLTLQVEGASEEYERLRAGGLSFDLELRDEPWGQRRFGVVDPAGMWVDVVEQIAPVEGWWDPYVQ